MLNESPTTSFQKCLQCDFFDYVYVCNFHKQISLYFFNNGFTFPNGLAAWHMLQLMQLGRYSHSSLTDECKLEESWEESKEVLLRHDFA